MDTRAIVTIDGTAGSGKTTLARALASHFRFQFVGSGLFYRAVSAAVLRAGIPPTDALRIGRFAGSLDLDAVFERQEMVVILDGQPTEELRTEAINRSVAFVAAVPEVRARVTELLHQIGAARSCVVEGRDIGTVVFPDSPYQIYLDAGLELREARRAYEGGGADCVATRDRQDQERSLSPLAVPKEALRIDSGLLDAQCVFDLASAALRRRGLGKTKAEEHL